MSASLIVSSQAAFAILVGAAPLSEIRLPGEALYPEGIAADPDGALYVGSLKHGYVPKISAGASAQAEVFVEAGAGGLIEAIGLAVDADRGLLWVCSADLGAGPRAGQGPSALLSFDLSTAAARGAYPLPGGGFCNDVLVRASGEVLVTDSFNAAIYRLAGDALMPFAADKRWAVAEGAFGVNGLAEMGEDVFVVLEASGEMWRIRDGEIAQIALSRPLEFSDGLEAYGPNCFLVAEGAGRIALLETEPNGLRAEVTTILTDLAVPTSTAIAKGIAWAVESQLDILLDPAKAGASPKPFRLVRVPLETGCAVR